jgi:hypothetical protein
MAEMRRQIQEQAAAGVIEKCEGTPSSVYAIHMARHPEKKTLRFCLDARQLNANKVLMPYAMPDIDESLDRLAGYKYYCAFDLSAYFQQFQLAEDCRDLMAFLIWRYERLTFGVVNASFRAQRVLMEALAKFPGCESLRNFVDDICFGANSVKELCDKTRALMEFASFTTCGSSARKPSWRWALCVTWVLSFLLRSIVVACASVGIERMSWC